MRSILSKFLVVVISGLLILSLAITGIAYYTTSSLLHKGADTILTNLCQKEAARINDILNDIEKSVRIMWFNVTSELEDISQLKDRAFREHFFNHVEPHFFNIAANTNKALAFYLRFNPELTTPTAGFYATLNENHTQFELAKVTDFSLYSPEDTQQVGWYYQPVAAGKPTWMPPYRKQNFHNREIISYVIPIYIQDTMIGVVGMDVDFAALIETINAISIYQEGHAYLISPDGVSYNRPFHDDADSSAHTRRYAQAEVALQNGMTLKTCASYDDIQQEGYTILYRIMIVFLAVLVFSILFTIYTVRRIVAPLKKLTLAAEQISKGNVDVDLSCRSKDEIGTLSRVMQQTISIVKQDMRAMNALAYQDALTGLKNSTAYAEYVKKLDEKAKNPDAAFGVLIADLNYLKETNDMHGHEMGNELIIQAAKLLCNAFKRSPVFRIGGDEFAVLLENHDLEHVEENIAQLDEACAAAFLHAENHSIPVSLARGASLFRPGTDETFHDVFLRADQAMYEHKQFMKQKKM